MKKILFILLLSISFVHAAEEAKLITFPVEFHVATAIIDHLNTLLNGTTINGINISSENNINPLFNKTTQGLKLLYYQGRPCKLLCPWGEYTLAPECKTTIKEWETVIEAFERNLHLERENQSSNYFIIKSYKDIALPDPRLKPTDIKELGDWKRLVETYKKKYEWEITPLKKYIDRCKALPPKETTFYFCLRMLHNARKSLMASC